MVLLILAGLFALIFGKITITKQLRLTGKKARIYGALLLVLSYPLLFITGLLLVPLFSFMPHSSFLETIFQLVGMSIVAVGLAIPFRDK